MIKFIATDMDGTLLRDDKTFNEEIFEVIEKLAHKGVFFAPASSRPHTSLETTFAPVKDKVIIIAQNGASVFYQGKRMIGEKMEKTLVDKIIDVTSKFSNASLLLDGDVVSYTDNDFVREAMSLPQFGYDVKKIDDIRNIGEDIFKISLYDPTDNDGKIRAAIEEELKGLCETAVSAPLCLDFVANGVSKGLAVEKICKKLNIAFDEAAVFGDNFNDASMFEKVYYSFAMDNAKDSVKALARFVAENNNEDGVLKAIKKLCFEVEE